MSILTIKYSYAVRAAFFISFLFVMSLGLIGGCSDNGSGANDSQALTENDFAENSALKADLEEDVVVTFLESPMSEAPENDTGTLGEDDIPVAYDETTQQTFCWEDDDAGAMHIMELRDSEGSLILTVEANGDCVTEVIEAGNYIMSIYHDGSVEDSLPIFLVPDPQGSDQTRETDGFIDRFKLAASNVLKRIERVVTKDAQAQTDPVVKENIGTLLFTNVCRPSCNLRYADLRGASLNGAGLFNADLTRADLSGAKLNGADLGRSLMRGTIFSGAEMREASLDDATLFGARLDGTDLRTATFFASKLGGADFRGADLRGADLRVANLEDVDFRDADLDGALFGFATWCDGKCECAQEGSIGTCNGCAPVDICTGP